MLVPCFWKCGSKTNCMFRYKTRSVAKLAFITKTESTSKTERMVKKRTSVLHRNRTANQAVAACYLDIHDLLSRKHVTLKNQVFSEQLLKLTL